MCIDKVTKAKPNSEHVRMICLLNLWLTNRFLLGMDMTTTQNSF